MLSSAVVNGCISGFRLFQRLRRKSGRQSSAKPQRLANVEESADRIDLWMNLCPEF
jgi:hypothetical protein